MENFSPLFQQLILNFSAVIATVPSAQSLVTLVLGWILCNGRHTLSGVIRAAGPLAPKSHDAYQNFFSQATWAMDPLWKLLFQVLVKTLVSEQEGRPIIWIAGDDTLSKHYGRKIWGAGLYRDAVRSSKKHTAYAWGLNWVVIAMIVKVPWCKDCFIALPIYARLNPKTDAGKSRPKGKGSKKKKSTVTIMEEMIRIVAAWMPEAQFVFSGDGAYACLAGSMPENVYLISRIRCDASLYTAPPKRRKKKRGRPKTKGKRLPSPQEMARRVGRRWETRRIDMYGEIVERQLYTFKAIWYHVCPDRLIKIVIVRDPEGKVEDEYFFSTDLEMSPEAIVHCYTGRWAIEVAFRETKQYLGMDEPQARKKEAVLRITPFCLWLNSVIKLWFVLETRQEQQPTLLKNDPWYTHKNTISFQDMLGALRLHFWQNFIFTGSTFRDDFSIIRDFLLKSLAKVA
jgi:hypothetical protein